MLLSALPTSAMQHPVVAQVTLLDTEIDKIASIGTLKVKVTKPFKGVTKGDILTLVHSRSSCSRFVNVFETQDVNDTYYIAGEFIDKAQKTFKGSWHEAKRIY